MRSSASYSPTRVGYGYMIFPSEALRLLHQDLPNAHNQIHLHFTKCRQVFSRQLIAFSIFIGTGSGILEIPSELRKIPYIMV